MGGVRLMQENFIGYEIVGHEVLGVWKVITSAQIAISKKQVDLYKHIKTNVSGNIVTFRFETWQGEPLPFEPVRVEISGNDIETVNITLDEPELELTGTGNIIVKTLNEKVQNVELVVEL